MIHKKQSTDKSWIVMICLVWQVKNYYQDSRDGLASQ